MVTKRYLDAQTLLEDGWHLGAQVLASGFRPDFIVAIWRGGVPMGVAVQEFLKAYGVDADHIAIRTASYQGIDDQSSVTVYGLSYLVSRVTHEAKLLIVDDVFDTGHSVDAVIRELSLRARKNMPEDIRIAVPYHKPTRNQTPRVPDYVLHETEAWLKYPHSLEGLTLQEMREHRPQLAQIIEQARASEPEPVKTPEERA
jgi:hypoxanthine phosphoribosyltransferase